MSAIPVYIHDDGEGPAVVFLHAFPMDAGMWDPQVAQLHTDFRCLRPEFWGCGESPLPADDHSLDDFAAVVLRQLAALGVQRFAVVGLSMGGYAAFALLRQARERVSHLVLASTRSEADASQARASRQALMDWVRRDGVEAIAGSMRQRQLSPVALANPSLVARLREITARCTPQGVIACLEAMSVRPDSTAELGAIGVPTHVIAGGADVVTPAAEMRSMAGAIPNARFSLIADVGHFVNLEAPDQFNGFLKELLEPSR